MVYLDPTHWPAPSWLVSSVGRALHRYRRGHGFKSRTGLNFFQVLFPTTRFSSVLSCEGLLISSIHRSVNIRISYIENLHSTWWVQQWHCTYWWTLHHNIVFDKTINLFESLTSLSLKFNNGSSSRLHSLMQGRGKISAQSHIIAKQSCSPKGNLLLSPLLTLF